MAAILAANDAAFAEAMATRAEEAPAPVHPYIPDDVAAVHGAQAPVDEVPAPVTAFIPADDAAVNDAQAPAAEVPAPVTAFIPADDAAVNVAFVPAVEIPAPVAPAPAESQANIWDYATMDVGELAHMILLDLGLVEITPDPDDPNYDHSMDHEFCEGMIYSEFK